MLVWLSSRIKMALAGSFSMAMCAFRHPLFFTGASSSSSCSDAEFKCVCCEKVVALAAAAAAASVGGEKEKAEAEAEAKAEAKAEANKKKNTNIEKRVHCRVCDEYICGGCFHSAGKERIGFEHLLSKGDLLSNYRKNRMVATYILAGDTMLLADLNPDVQKSTEYGNALNRRNIYDAYQVCVFLGGSGV